MTTYVWPFFRAECDTPGCGWVGSEHLSLDAAQRDAENHQVTCLPRPTLMVVQDSPKGQP